MSSVAHAEAHLNDGDQHQHQAPAADRFHEGKVASHDLLDGKDERSIANNLAAAEKAEKEEKAREEADKPLPTELAKAHGNKPSRGARVDEEILLQEQAELERKGKA
ncbi:hypothetical protein BCR35DRAFT_184483 [Leucosporidium creatinivorum]|uniref:Uncharacterized protein n=1 Tax=Leucosporidium creatinivorum TaxID=106004 RepID=A0A1Y2E280_9BASI|nr:hypothetical protein BCR35DRAFT_184483 [Leucosporidium creatinivorum]